MTRFCVQHVDSMPSVHEQPNTKQLKQGQTSCIQAWFSWRKKHRISVFLSWVSLSRTAKLIPNKGHKLQCSSVASRMLMPSAED